MNAPRITGPVFALGTLLGMFCSGRLPVSAEQASDEARAQEYLEAIGRSWAKSLPQEQVLGVYFGRRWVGQACLAVKAAAAGEGAAYEVTWSVETKVSGKRVSTRERILLAPPFTLVSAQCTEEGPDGKISRTLSIQEGKWKVRREEKGKATHQEGVLKPGTTWNASFLPLFVRPEPPGVTLTALDADQSPVAMTPPSVANAEGAEGPKGKEVLIEVRRGSGNPGLWRFSREGAALEYRPGGSLILFRPSSPEKIGKDLEDALALPDAAKALVELFRSVKKGDRLAVAAAFDFEKLAQNLVPGYGDLDPVSKRQVVDTLRAKTPVDLISPKFRDTLPDDALMEDFVAAASAVSEQNGIAEVKLFDKGAIWKLCQVAEGKQKGRWLVSGIKP